MKPATARTPAAIPLERLMAGAAAPVWVADDVAAVVVADSDSDSDSDFEVDVDSVSVDVLVGRAEALVMYDLVKEEDLTTEELANEELAIAELEMRGLELAMWLGDAKELE